MSDTQKLFIVGFFLVSPLSLLAQDDGMRNMPLEDLSAFQEQAGNWRIVGDVTMDPTQDIHHEEQAPKKKKKKKGDEPAEAVSTQAGTGILVNLPTEEKKDNLLTSWEHGDLEIELEVMLPKGSNSGLYLQGRYEVQLFDSWGVKTAQFTDIGGIYRNWESDPEKSYMGKAPLVNAAKAPGLWQKLKVAFQAPRFDPEGKKTANARIIYAELNGVRIHENIELPKPTGGPIENNEVVKGPIMVQGDHGAVAFRNIRYKHMQPSGVSLTDIIYQVKYGAFDDPEKLQSAPVEKEGSLDLLTYDVTDRDNNFGIVYRGTLNIPIAGEYRFSGDIGGSASLKVNDHAVFTGWRRGIGSAYLEEGAYPFELVYYKTHGGLDPRLSFTVETASTYPKALHTLSSAPPGGGGVAPILVEPEKGPRLLRAFLDFKGDRDQRLTHSIGVGEPGGIHYIYDLKAGNVVCVWKGPFVDATPMWHDRGDGSFRPLGMIQYLFTGPSIASLEDENAPFMKRDTYLSNGYQLDPVSGRPIFNYEVGNAKIRDEIKPDEDMKQFIRKVIIEDPGENIFLKAAEGSKVEKLPNDWYAIDDKQYYISISSDHQPIIRNVGGKQELLLPVGNTPIIYSLTW